MHTHTHTCTHTHTHAHTHTHTHNAKVCPLGFTSLWAGVFVKLYGLLEDECHNLDLELALHSSEDAHSTFSTYSQELQKLHLLQAEIAQVTDKVQRIVKEHLISITPQVVAAIPPPQKRKKLVLTFGRGNMKIISAFGYVCLQPATAIHRRLMPCADSWINHRTD